MNRWEWAALFAVVTALAALAAAGAAGPAYMDAYYYFNGALRLAQGAGFSEPYLWNYLAPVRTLPAPSHLYWMPLTSLVAAPFVAGALALGGDVAAAFRAGQIPLALAAAGLAWLAGRIAWTLSGRRRHAWAAALLTVLNPFYWPFWGAPDSFALFGLTAAGALWAGAQAATGRGWLAAGLLAGLAHLARADGVLIAISLAVFALAAGRPLEIRRRGLSTLGPAAGLGLGYLLAMSPWFIRNLGAIGAPLAPGGLRALWLLSYDELYTFTPAMLTPARYLAAGWGALWPAKWETLAANLQAVVAIQSSIVAFPLALAGAWRGRRDSRLWPAGLYGAALFAAMTFAFTFPGLRGGYFHSGTALVPFINVLALAGLDHLVEAAARRLPHWRPERSRPIFTALLVLVVGALALARLPARPAAPPDAVYIEIGAWLTRAGVSVDSPVAVNNPPAFYYHTGRAAIAVPAGERADLQAAMAAFGARWLVLDVNVVAGLWPLYSAPAADPGFVQRAVFQDAAGRPVYVLEAAAP